MRSQPIKAVVLDLGGVLLDWNPRHLYKRYFEEPAQMEQFLSEINFAAWNAMQDKGRPFRDGVAELSSLFPHRAALIRAYQDRWEESIKGPVPGMAQIVRAVKAAGYPLYGLTNWSAETFPIAYRKYGDLFDLFDHIVVSGEVHLLKPDPRIFDLAIQAAGVQPSQCLFIDDGPENIAAATRMGFQAIHFVSAEQLEHQLLSMELLEPSWRRTIGP
jgi:2-haloacid dehalogenase